MTWSVNLIATLWSEDKPIQLLTASKCLPKYNLLTVNNAFEFSCFNCEYIRI